MLNCFHDFADQARSGSCLRSYYSRFAVRPFRYFADPLFLACCALYAVNRWLIKPLVPIAFFHNWFSDLLLIPCALPPLLWVQSHLGLRSRDTAPAWREIGFHLVVWSVLFEVIGPFIYPRAVGDWRDVLAYLAGGLVAGWWWNVAPRRAQARL